jgi:hypothetical protein
MRVMRCRARRDPISSMSRPGDDAETTYVRGVDQPWIPFDPLSEHVLNERVLIRYHRIDPVEGQSWPRYASRQVSGRRRSTTPVR